jgi:hypothetical protein
MILRTALQELVAELLVSPTPGEDPNSDIRENSLRCLASCLTEVEMREHESGQSYPCIETTNKSSLALFSSRLGDRQPCTWSMLSMKQ